MIKNINCKREHVSEEKDVLILYNEFWQEITRGKEVTNTEFAYCEFGILWFGAIPNAKEECDIFITLSSLKDFIDKYQNDEK